MYPTLSDLLREIFPKMPALPIQTFGLMMAISFAGAYYATSSELKRKEREGLLKPIMRRIIKFQRVTTQDYIIQTLIGALIGYKLVYILMNYADLVASPQAMILSAKGSFLGAVVGGAWAYMQRWREHREMRKHDVVEMDVAIPPHQLMWTILVIAAISGLIGAKIFHNLENLDDLMRDPVDALLSFSGLTFYGGLIVATGAVLYYTNKNKIPTLHMIDAAAPGLMLAYGIGRIGCQLSGDGDWGIVNTAPKPASLSFLPDWMWSSQYPHNVINEGVPIPGCEGPHCFMLPEPVFPTPLYEVLMALALFAFLWSIRKKIKTPGMLFCIYLVVNGVERFLIEKIRVNNTYDIFGKHITQAELISTLLVLTGLAGMVWLSRRQQKVSA